MGAPFLIILSFVIVALGQPAWVHWTAPLAASIGYALMWKALTAYPTAKTRFWLATIWFGAVQTIQLSWMTSYEYQGIYILFIYLVFAFGLGLQFGLFSFFLPLSGERLGALRALMLASLWTLMEWSRLFFLSGFTWNPSGIALTSVISSMQLAALWGVFGLSFWVMLTNLAAFRFFSEKRVKPLLAFLILAAIPYLFGWGHLTYYEGLAKGKEQEVSLALIQTGLLPPEKLPQAGRFEEFVFPLHQWKRVLTYLQEQRRAHWDYIVLPEVAMPFGFAYPLYRYEDVLIAVNELLGPHRQAALPPMLPPYAEKKEDGQWWVSNAFFAQMLANTFHADVVAGFEDEDRHLKRSYNAAFHLRPHQCIANRYEKRVLLPLAEYLPFEWCRSLSYCYGVSEFFTAGEEAKIFDSKIQFAPLICYEETFSDLVRECRLKGADLFINVVNDNWYPNSRLAKQHFDHGKLRAVENGVPLVRACNTGVTAVLDGHGRTMAIIAEETRGVLTDTFNFHQHKTLYTFWGEGGIISLCFILFTLYFRLQNKTCSKC